MTLMTTNENEAYCRVKMLIYLVENGLYSVGRGCGRRVPEVYPVNTEQPSLDKRDEDRIAQIDTNLYTLNRQMTDI